MNKQRLGNFIAIGNGGRIVISFVPGLKEQSESMALVLETEFENI